MLYLINFFNKILYEFKVIAYAVAAVWTGLSIILPLVSRNKGKKSSKFEKKKFSVREILRIGIALIFIIVAVLVVRYTNSLIKVPDIEGKLYKDAKIILTNAGLSFNTIQGQEENFVIEQIPKAGSVERKDKPVFLILATSTPTPFPILTLAPTPASVPTSTLAPTSMPTPTPTLEPEPTWGPWTKDDTLTRDSRYEYQQEYKTEYSYQERETTTSGQNKMDGWDLYHSDYTWGNYGTWSGWSTVKTDATDAVKVESEEQYRYRDKQFTTAKKAELSGWTVTGSDYEWSDYGTWSDWSSTAVGTSETKKVETKTQYRYQDRQMTSGNSNTMSGWTLDSSRTEVMSTWGGWSDWSTTAVLEAENREIETRVVNITVPSTEYRYQRVLWYNADGILSSSKTPKSGYTQGTPKKGNKQWRYDYTDWMPESQRVTGVYNPDWKIDVYWVRVDEGYYVEESRTVSNTVSQTQYRYRDRVHTYTYYFYKWGAWSEWGDTVVNQTDMRNIETRTVYRFATRAKEYTYYFWRWATWSEWDNVVRYTSDTREIEKRTVYRYATRKKIYTYYFERYSEWSPYSLEEPEEKKDREIDSQSVPYYRYRLRR